MALDATDAAVNVNRMVEIDVIRHLMDLHPFDRLACGRAVAHHRQTGIILEHLGVAVHAD